MGVSFSVLPGLLVFLNVVVLGNDSDAELPGNWAYNCHSSLWLQCYVDGVGSPETVGIEEGLFLPAR